MAEAVKVLIRQGVSGVGRRSTISMSNTRKIRASRKNRSENGVRAKLLGSNPHSKGEIFSRSIFVRVERIKPAPQVSILRVVANKIENKTFISQK